MADEPTMGELGRQIESVRQGVTSSFDQMRRDNSDDFGTINRRLDTFLLKEVYLADEQRRELRFTALEDEIKRNRTNRFTVLTLAFSAVLAPVIVGLITFSVTRGFA